MNKNMKQQKIKLYKPDKIKVATYEEIGKHYSGVNPNFINNVRIHVNTNQNVSQEHKELKEGDIGFHKKNRVISGKSFLGW